MAASDADMAQDIKSAADALAAAMNTAGRAGLEIHLNMKPHASECDARGNVKTYGYIPILSVSRKTIL